MQLVELAFPPEASAAARARARNFCQALGKTPVEVPDIPGFVVNRLLFPYLFSAVELLAQTGMDPQDIDSCMTLARSDRQSAKMSDRFVKTAKKYPP